MKAHRKLCEVLHICQCGSFHTPMAPRVQLHRLLLCHSRPACHPHNPCWQCEGRHAQGNQEWALKQLAWPLRWHMRNRHPATLALSTLLEGRLMTFTQLKLGMPDMWHQPLHMIMCPLKRRCMKGACRGWNPHQQTGRISSRGHWERQLSVAAYSGQGRRMQMLHT